MGEQDGTRLGNLKAASLKTLDWVGFGQPNPFFISKPHQRENKMVVRVLLIMRKELKS